MKENKFTEIIASLDKNIDVASDIVEEAWIEHSLSEYIRSRIWGDGDLCNGLDTTEIDAVSAEVIENKSQIIHKFVAALIEQTIRELHYDNSVEEYLNYE